MKNNPQAKKPALFALLFTIAGSVSVISQADSSLNQASILDSNELPKVTLAADYKPCGNTIKCPPPPANGEEKNEDKNNDTNNEESNTNAETNNNESNNNSGSTSNPAQAPKETSAPQVVVNKNSYSPSSNYVNEMEQEFKSRIAPIIDLSKTEEIEDFLEKELRKQSTVVKILNSDGKEIPIKNGKKIVFINDIDEAKKKRLQNDEAALIIDPSTDSDGDRIADVAEILFFSTDPFNRDTDMDGFWDGHEIDYGTAASSDSKPNIHEPGVTNLHGLTTDQKPIIKGIGLPGENITIEAFNLETGKTQEVCSTEIDIIGKFACQPEKDLSDGVYYLYSNHLPKNGKAGNDRRFTRIIVKTINEEDNNGEAEIKEVESQTFKNFEQSRSILRKYLGNTHFEKHLQAFFEKLEKSSDKEKQVITGKSTPNEIILVTWQSYSLNSVLIADASQGKFEALVPEALESGEHKAFVYSYDTNQKFLKFINKLIFNKS